MSHGFCFIAVAVAVAVDPAAADDDTEDDASCWVSWREIEVKKNLLFVNYTIHAYFPVI